jgi:hypothetical protein
MAIELTEAIEDSEVQRFQRRLKRLKATKQKALAIKSLGTRVILRNGDIKIEIEIDVAPEEDSMTAVFYDFMDEIADEVQLKINKVKERIQSRITELTT